MGSLSYKANFIDLVTQDEMLPQSFYPDEGLSRPSNKFIVSKTKSGDVLSVYGDDIWDFRPYQLAGDSGPARIHFDTLPSHLIEEAKWLMFLFIYVVDSGKATALSVATLDSYMRTTRSLSLYASKRELIIKEVLEDEDELISYISTLSAKCQLRSLSSFIKNLISVGTEISGLDILGERSVHEILKKISTYPDYVQHPVIPPRLLSALIDQLSALIEDNHDNLEQLILFIENMEKDSCFGRSHVVQRNFGYRLSNFSPTFSEASKIYGLDLFFQGYRVKDVKSFSTFLTQFQHGCRMMIHIYSGMRKSEAFSLKSDCLFHSNGTYKFIGETSKLIGQKKQVAWITSQNIQNAYEFLNKLSKVLGKTLNLKPKDTPLFITPSYIVLSRKGAFDGENVWQNVGSCKKGEVFNLLNVDEFRITEADIADLEKVDPFRAWESEEAFAIGEVWRFTTHQFRRSLAFYASQSSVVSLPTLKRQLKHISREMTIYYCQTRQLDEDFKNKDHPSMLMMREKPLADAMTYLNQIILSDEQLFGAHGKFVEKNMVSQKKEWALTYGREELVKKFKNGEIAYKETALGACMTIKPCDKKAMREIAACVSCDRAVIKPSKLIKTIKRQEEFVCELKKMNPDSVEYRYEKSELDILKHYKTKVIKRG